MNPRPLPRPIPPQTPSPRGLTAAPQATRLPWVRLLATLALLAGAVSPSTAAPEGPTPPPTPLSVERPHPSRQVSFHREILPFLQPNCLPCHNQTTPKGDLILESPASMRQGGETGPALIPGQATNSLLFQVSTHAVKPRMPPRENKVNASPLTPAQLGLLAEWIDQGAHADSTTDAPIPWQPLTTNVVAIFATAVSPDGRLVAAGRGNQIHVHRPALPGSVEHLRDPGLGEASQRDLINALAFSPDGRWLAAGGFRQARLWHRDDPIAETLPGVAPTPHLPAQVSPDATRIAFTRANGSIDLVRRMDGTLERSLSTPSPAPTVLRFSPDGRFLAAGNLLGDLRAWDLSQPEPAATRSTQLTHAILDLAWVDKGQRLAVALDTPAPDGLLTFRVTPAPADSTGFLPGPPRPTHPTSLVDADPLGPGLLVASADADGKVRLWPEDATREPVVLDPGAPPAGLLALPSPRRLAIATRPGGTQIWSTDNAPKRIATLAGDPGLEAEASMAARAFDFAKAEVDFQTNALQRQEGDVRKRTEDSKKAAEKLAAQEKAYQEKQDNLAAEESKKSEAEKDKNAASSQLDQARTAQDSAAKAAEAARLAAKEAAAKSTELNLAADRGARARTDLERILQDLTTKAESPTLAQAHTAVAQAVQAANGQATQAKEAAEAALRAIDTLTLLATTAGEAKAAAARANQDLPPRIQDAEKRITAAGKAAEALKPEAERARIQRDTAAEDVQLARRNLEAAERAVAATRQALAEAGRSVATAEAQHAQAKAARDAALNRGHLWMGLTPDRSCLATLDDRRQFTLWSVGTLQPVASRPLGPDSNHPLALVPSTQPDANPTAPQGTLLILQGHQLQSLTLGGRWRLVHSLGEGALSSNPPAALTDRITALAFSPDGRLLATGGGEPSRSSELKLWSVADGSLVRDLGSPHSDTILGLAFHPNGRQLASGGADRFARILDPVSGRVLRNLEGHTHHVLAVAWKADGRVLASAGGEGTVKLWNPETGERLKNIEGFGKEVSGIQALGLAPEFLAVSGAGQARVFKEDGSQVRTLPVGNAFLTSLAVTPDGRLAVAGSDDGVLRAWTVPDGKPLAEWK